MLTDVLAGAWGLRWHLLIFAAICAVILTFDRRDA